MTMVDYETQDPEPIKRMSVKEFRELGYLQELNRKFLHPLGLALEVERYPNSEIERFNLVWDCRDDPEGLVFAPGILDEEKALHIGYEEKTRAEARMAKLGYVIQPVKDED